LKNREEKVDQLRDIIKNHLENSKVLEDIKSHIVQNKDLTQGDKNAII
jgi:hypothetical protein